MYQKLRSLLVAACLFPASLLPTTVLAANPRTIAPTSANSMQLAQNTYPAEVVNIYMEVCVNSAKNSGVSAEVATSYCRCSIDQFQRAYTMDKFLQLVQSSTPGQLPPELESIASSCAASITN